MIKKWFIEKLELTSKLQEENMVLAAVGMGSMLVFYQNVITIKFNIIKINLVKALILPFIKEDPTEA